MRFNGLKSHLRQMCIRDRYLHWSVDFLEVQ